MGRTNKCLRRIFIEFPDHLFNKANKILVSNRVKILNCIRKLSSICLSENPNLALTFFHEKAI